jgi:hypothetical protein
MQRIQLRRKRLILHAFSGRRGRFCIHVIREICPWFNSALRPGRSSQPCASRLLCLTRPLLSRRASDALIGSASNASGASTQKQIRTAQREAARAKKNAELKTFEKNGYQSGRDLTSYPQNLQNAERKAAPKPTNTLPASAQ